jgi:hypothetical protein
MMYRRYRIMKKVTGIIFLIAMIGVFAVVNGRAQSNTPIRAWVVADKTVYDFNAEPINILIRLENNSGAEVITPESFGNKRFDLLLKFTYIDSDGKEKVIVANETGEYFSPPTPDMLPQDLDGDGRYDTVEKITRWANGWVRVIGPFDAYSNYNLKPEKFVVKVSTSTRFIDQANVFTYTGEEYAYIMPGPGDSSGPLWSSKFPLCIRDDGDDDGYYYPACQPNETEDCDDGNAGVNPGIVEMSGNDIDDDCNPETADIVSAPDATINILAENYTVSGVGSRPASYKNSIKKMHIRIFDRTSFCVTNYGVAWKNTGLVWSYCPDIGEKGNDYTNDSGNVNFTVPAGEYFLIGEYVSSVGGKIYIGRDIGVLRSGETRQEYMQVIVRPDGSMVSGKYRKLTGSELLIIEPEYIEWNGTEEFYPFIFESIGDWTVTTSVSPPEGFVADYKSLTGDVLTEMEAVQFIITDVGSRWEETGVVHTVKHKGKTEKVKTSIGIKCSKKLAKKKGFDEFCKKKE